MSKDNKSLSVAYGMQRHKPKKYADGGMVATQTSEGEPIFPGPKTKYAQGGAVPYKAGSIVEAILSKRKTGQVDLEANSEESGNYGDELNMEADGKEQYDDGQISPQPTDSNEMSTSIESDAHDMVSAIRRMMKKKAE